MGVVEHLLQNFALDYEDSSLSLSFAVIIINVKDVARMTTRGLITVREGQVGVFGVGKMILTRWKRILLGMQLIIFWMWSCKRLKEWDCFAAPTCL